MKSLASTTSRRRVILLCAGCCIPLLFIASTTSFFHTDYFDNTFLSKKPVQSALASESKNSGLLRPWEPNLPPSVSPIPTSSPTHAADTLPEGWIFDPRRDEQNFGLNDAQCDAAFPDLYKEIERAVAFRQNNNLDNVKEEELDISWRGGGEIIRLMIHDRQLYVIDVKWSEHGFDVPRAIAIVHSIHRSIIAYQGPIPNIEFTMSLGDWPGDEEARWPIWVLTRYIDEEDKWVMPDFGYWSWPLDVVGEYSQVRRDIQENEPSWDSKYGKAVWRGAIATNQLREDLVKAANGKHWSDVHDIVWQNMTTLAPGMEKLSITMPEHCNYQYVIHTEGHTYSGRGKYLLNCNSVSVIHKPLWIEPHTHLFVPSGPMQNVVQVERDFSDLNSKLNHLLSNEAEARRIAERSVKQFRDRYLTPAAQACYWRRLFRAWKTVSFEPEFYQTVKERNGKIRRKCRGTPFETFVSQLVLPAKPSM